MEEFRSLPRNIDIYGIVRAGVCWFLVGRCVELFEIRLLARAQRRITRIWKENQRENDRQDGKYPQERAEQVYKLCANSVFA